jgi:flagellar protein FlbD
MIKLTKFTGEEIFINAEIIKTIENAADTVLVLSTDERILIKESAEEVQELFMKYKKEIHGTTNLTSIF